MSDQRREAILRDISDDIAEIMSDTLSGTDCDALARKIAEGAIRHVAVPELGVALNSASALQAFFSTYAPWDELQPPLRERAEAIVAAIRAAKTEKALNQVMLAQRGTLNDIQLASETAHGWIMSEASRRLVEVVE